MFDSSVTLKCFLQYKINVVFLAEAFRIKEFKCYLKVKIELESIYVKCLPVRKLSGNQMKFLII